MLRMIFDGTNGPPSPVYDPSAPPPIRGENEPPSPIYIPDSVVNASLGPDIAPLLATGFLATDRFSSPVEEDELASDNEAPPTKQRRLEAESPRAPCPSPRYNLRPRQPRQTNPQVLAELYNQMDLSPQRSTRRRSDDSAYTPARALTLKPRSSLAKRKKQKSLAARRRLRNLDSSAPPSSGDSGLVHSVPSDPQDSLSGALLDQSKILGETAADTFLNSMMGPNGEAPSFTFTAPRQVDSSPPSSDSSHDLHLDSPLRDPVVRFRMAFLFLRRSLAPFFFCEHPSEMIDAAATQRISRAIGLADIWYFHTSPLYPSIPDYAVTGEFEDF